MIFEEDDLQLERLGRRSILYLRITKTSDNWSNICPLPIGPEKDQFSMFYAGAIHREQQVFTHCSTQKFVIAHKYACKISDWRKCAYLKEQRSNWNNDYKTSISKFKRLTSTPTISHHLPSVNHFYPHRHHRANTAVQPRQKGSFSFSFAASPAGLCHHVTTSSFLPRLGA
jgi:hypothetical protein